MTIKARTDYTEKSIKNFAKFNMFRFPWQIITYAILEFIMLCFSVGLFSMMFSGPKEIRIIMIPVLAVPAILVLGAVPFALWRLPAKTAKMSRRMFGAAVFYEFSEDEIIINSMLPTNTGQVRANYQYFDKVYETKTAFYLFISKREAFVLEKAGITEGSISDLQELFRKNIPGKKYIRKGM